MHICGFFRTFAADFNFVIMSQRYLLPMAALCLLLVSCNQNEPDYSVKGKECTYSEDTYGYYNFIFFDDYVQVTLRFDSITPDGFWDGTMTNAKYEQEKQNVTIYNVVYDVPPHEKDSDLHIISFGDYIIHAGRRFDKR